jgi:hypothetical protein
MPPWWFLNGFDHELGLMPHYLYVSTRGMVPFPFFLSTLNIIGFFPIIKGNAFSAQIQLNP